MDNKRIGFVMLLAIMMTAFIIHNASADATTKAMYNLQLAKIINAMPANKSDFEDTAKKLFKCSISVVKAQMAKYEKEKDADTEMLQILTSVHNGFEISGFLHNNRNEKNTDIKIIIDELESIFEDVDINNLHDKTTDAVLLLCQGNATVVKMKAYKAIKELSKSTDDKSRAEYEEIMKLKNEADSNNLESFYGCNNASDLYKDLLKEIEQFKK